MLADIDKGVRGLRIGFDLKYATAAATAEQVAAVQSALETLRQLGAVIVDVVVPDTTDVPNVWNVLCAKEAAVAHRANFPSHADQYGPYLREYLKIGTSISNADYDKAVRFRKDFASKYSNLVASVDSLACPVSAALPITKEAQYGTVAEFSAAVDKYFRQFNPVPTVSIATMPMNFAGIPTLTLPCGFSKDHMPMALQLVGSHMSEPLLCRIGHTYETATEWHRQHPTV